MWISVVLLAVYASNLFFALVTHRALFAGSEHGEDEAHGTPWSVGRALGVLTAATVGVAWMSEILVGAIEPSAHALGLTDGFVGVFVVSILGNAAEHFTAITAALKNRMDLSLSIAISSSVQVALFVAPLLVLVSYAIAPAPWIWPLQRRTRVGRDAVRPHRDRSPATGARLLKGDGSGGLRDPGLAFFAPGRGGGGQTIDQADCAGAIRPGRRARDERRAQLARRLRRLPPSGGRRRIGRGHRAKPRCADCHTEPTGHPPRVEPTGARDGNSPPLPRRAGDREPEPREHERRVPPPRVSDPTRCPAAPSRAGSPIR